MKKFGFSTLAIFLCFIVSAQTDSLVRWQVQSIKISSGVYEIVAKTTIPVGWHLYGTNPGVEGLGAPQMQPNYEKALLPNPAIFDQSPQKIVDPLFENKQLSVYTGTLSFKQRVKIEGFIPITLSGIITANLGKSNEFHPSEQIFEVALAGGEAIADNAKKIKLPSVNLANPISACGQNTTTGTTEAWSIFFLGFLGGLIALLTPCVFPMIPVTVSFFTKKASNRKQAIRNGVLYGFFILLIYLLASVPFHILGNVQPEVFNNISTNAWLNSSFFVIFIFFAFSFFGFFEITLPGNMASKTDAKSGFGSVVGIFFMALTLAIVSFSCTGPILGSLLVGSLSGGAWQLTSGMAGFGLALALPFALFAIFPNWLHSLPKSGGWLDTVKKVLAFVELALAFKFLSNADLVMHWGLLKRETFIGIWILISSGLTLYLFGLIRLPHDTKGMKISTGRKVVGFLALIFTLYLLPGITQSKYANLQLVSGFPPPFSYSIYGKENIAGKGLEANVVNDYTKALQLAKEQHKPLLIDFTGWACVNCRKMEENVWTDPAIYSYIKENFILVSLYVDDKAKLPVEQRFTYSFKEGSTKEIISIGDKWATFQTENFGQSTQPLYVILDEDEKLVNHSVGYTPNVKAYRQWLQCGKETFDGHQK